MVLLHKLHDFDLDCNEVVRVAHLYLLHVLCLRMLGLRQPQWVVHMLALFDTPSLVDMLEGLGVEWPRTLPGARALGVLEVAYHAADMPPDRMVAMLGMSGPTSTGWLAPLVPFVVVLRPLLAWLLQPPREELLFLR